MNDFKKNSVLIVGAGISGLTLGHFLTQKGFSVSILEKSSGVGGRIATRRGDGGHWNHGIPRINRNEIPGPLGIIWSESLAQISNSEGLTQYAKILAKDLTVHKKSRAIKIEFVETGPGWRVTDDTNRVFCAELLILTCPIPQTVDLLNASEFLKTTGMATALSEFRYRPHLVGLAKIETQTSSSGEKKAEPPFELIVNHHGFFTVYMDESFSLSRWSLTDEEISNEIRAFLGGLGYGIVRHFELKRWRYSRCVNPSQMSYIKAEKPYPLFVIGDAFCGGEITGAIQSALKLSESLSVN